MNPDKQGCFSLLQEEVLAGYLNKNLPIEPRELSFSFSPASLQLKEASGAEERGAVLELAHFKTQKQCFKIETQLENSTCFIQSSSYSPDSIIYKNDKEINSPESESRKQRKERLMAGVLFNWWICIRNAAFDKRGGLGSSNSNISSAVASTPASTRTIFKATW